MDDVTRLCLIGVVMLLVTGIALVLLGVGESNGRWLQLIIGGTLTLVVDRLIPRRHRI